MSKVKTRKSIASRFKITGTGKVMRRVAFGRHLRVSKSAAQKRRYGKMLVTTPKIARKVKRLLGQA